MKTDKPFSKSFACGGAMFVFILVLVMAMGGLMSAYRFGFIMASCLFPALITGTWAFFSKKRWPWGRFVGTFIVVYLVLALLNAQGRAQRQVPGPSSRRNTPASNG